MVRGHASVYEDENCLRGVNENEDENFLQINGKHPIKYRACTKTKTKTKTGRRSRGYVPAAWVMDKVMGYG